MKNFIEQFQKTLTIAYSHLAEISEEHSAEPLGEGKWSRREYLGHLIDSASNNHQRFVRAQLLDELFFPEYEQERWVHAQNYKNEKWIDLVVLWKSYNQHLLHVVGAIPENQLGKKCVIGNKEPMTLSELIEDYLRHMRQHLEQVTGKPLS